MCVCVWEGDKAVMEAHKAVMERDKVMIGRSSTRENSAPCPRETGSGLIRREIVINVCLGSAPQKLMVKRTQKSGHPKCTIFGLIFC